MTTKVECERKEVSYRKEDDQFVVNGMREVTTTYVLSLFENEVGEHDYSEAAYKRLSEIVLKDPKYRDVSYIVRTSCGHWGVGAEIDEAYQNAKAAGWSRKSNVLLQKVAGRKHYADDVYVDGCGSACYPALCKLVFVFDGEKSPRSVKTVKPIEENVIEWKKYPPCDSSRSGCKVGWRSYRNQNDAKKCAEAAQYNAGIQMSRGYDFGYQCPGSICETKDGMFEVCIP